MDLNPATIPGEESPKTGKRAQKQGPNPFVLRNLRRSSME
jgi:hypothetical protein